jgi:hypothetical protein
MIGKPNEAIKPKDLNRIAKINHQRRTRFPYGKISKPFFISKITAPLKVNFVGIVPVIALYKINLVCIKQKYKMATTTAHIVMVQNLFNIERG